MLKKTSKRETKYFSNTKKRNSSQHFILGRTVFALWAFVCNGALPEFVLFFEDC